ncbi:MAG: hypothetical protein WBX22_31630 [Silvibacterium sp.]
MRIGKEIKPFAPIQPSKKRHWSYRKVLTVVGIERSVPYTQIVGFDTIYPRAAATHI